MKKNIWLTSLLTALNLTGIAMAQSGSTATARVEPIEEGRTLKRISKVKGLTRYYGPGRTNAEGERLAGPETPESILAYIKNNRINQIDIDDERNNGRITGHAIMMRFKSSMPTFTAQNCDQTQQNAIAAVYSDVVDNYVFGAIRMDINQTEGHGKIMRFNSQIGMANQQWTTENAMEFVFQPRTNRNKLQFDIFTPQPIKLAGTEYTYKVTAAADVTRLSQEAIQDGSEDWDTQETKSVMQIEISSADDTIGEDDQGCFATAEVNWGVYLSLLPSHSKQYTGEEALPSIEQIIEDIENGVLQFPSAEQKQVNQLIKLAEDTIAALNDQIGGLNQNITDLNDTIDAYKKANAVLNDRVTKLTALYQRLLTQDPGTARKVDALRLATRGIDNIVYDAESPINGAISSNSGYMHQIPALGDALIKLNKRQRAARVNGDKTTEAKRDVHAALEDILFVETVMIIEQDQNELKKLNEAFVNEVQTDVTPIDEVLGQISAFYGKRIEQAELNLKTTLTHVNSYMRSKNKPSTTIEVLKECANEQYAANQ